MKEGKITGLAHIGLFVKDLERSKRFYEDILGFECIFEYLNNGVTPVAFERLGSCVIEIVQQEETALADGWVDHIAFAVENIEDVRDQLSAKGITFIEDEIVHCPECFENGAKWILFRGPDGEHLEITEAL